jgi:hypothetical protein
MPDYPMVLDAVRKYAETEIGDHYTEIAPVYQAIARQLGVDLYSQRWQDRKEGEALFARVGRALNRLADDGVLVKVGKGQEHPSGQRESGAAFYTKSGYAKAVEKGQQQRLAERVERDRWADIRNNLERRGVHATTAPGQPVQLSLDEWENLLGQLAKGNGGW